MIGPVLLPTIAVLVILGSLRLLGERLGLDITATDGVYGGSSPGSSISGTYHGVHRPLGVPGLVEGRLTSGNGPLSPTQVRFPWTTRQHPQPNPLGLEPIASGWGTAAMPMH